MKLGASATVAFAVKEQSVYEDSQIVSNLTPDLLMSYVSGWPLSDNAKRLLTAIAERKKQIAETDSAIRMHETEVRDATREQERLRENIRTLNAVAGQQEQV